MADRNFRVDGDERWYQLVIGNEAAELHVDGGRATLHRYRRVSTPDTPAYLLDGFVATDSIEWEQVGEPVTRALRAAQAAGMTLTDDDRVWLALRDFIGPNRRARRAQP